MSPGPPPARFTALVARVAAADAGIRLDAYLRQRWQVLLPPPQQQPAPAAAAAALAIPAPPAEPHEIPIATLHKWARLRLLRVQPADGGSLPPRDDLCTHRVGPNDSVWVHRDIAATLAMRPPPPLAPHPSQGGKLLPGWLTPSAILHVSPSVVALRKPAGLPVQGGSGIDRGGCIDVWLPGVAAVAREVEAAQARGKRPVKGSTGGGPRTVVDAGAPGGGGEDGEDGALRLVHRLDRDVSGVLLLARGRAAAGALAAAFRANTVAKTYVAVVAAPLPRGVRPTGVVSAPVVDAEFGRTGKLLHREEADAETAYTAHELTLQHPQRGTSLPPTITLLFLEPTTGRKHQLRQHVLQLWRGAHGILGDTRYHGGLPAATRAALRVPPPPPPAARGGGGGGGGEIAVDVRSQLHALGGLAGRVDGAGGGGPPLLQLHALKVVLPAGTLGAELQPHPLFVKDEMPAGMAALLRAYGWPRADGPE